MKKILLFLALFIGYLTLQAQTVLTIENQSIVNSDPEWDGYNVPHDVKTTLTFKNNAITSVNTSMYLLQAGDDYPASTINNLDGAVITGNKLTWNGVQTGSIITHGLFVGYNINQTVKWNSLTNCPYNIIFKSGGSAAPNMNITAGGASYNIVKGGRFAGRCKGINGARFYNNTFYGDAGSWYLLLINANTDAAPTYPGNPSINTKVKNNIFYTTTKTPSINIDAGSRTGFECDYNVYWCEAGDHEPIFTVAGTTYTWTQWKALGYDTHSVVLNPNFNNTTAFVPAARLDYGTNLGTEFNTGLSTSATWVVGTTPATQVQNGTWQVGARVFAPAVVAVPPTVTTTAVSSITTTTATSGGNVTSDGGATVTARGVCWDQSGSPALDNPFTTNGTGTGTFTSNITGLSPSTTYYVRSYATNSAGTGYGNIISFTTSAVAPTPYLYVSKSALTIPATANSDGKFNIISNTTWDATTPATWLTITTQLFYRTGGQNYVTQPYSGSAPDIGAYEYLQSNVSGHDSAFITLTAEANPGATRNATVTVTGTGVSPQTVAVTQTGTPQTVNTYYISSTGNDANNGTSEATPWQTLSKVNSINKLPGDKYLFKRGDTFRGYLLIDDNGTSGNPITIDAYGTGAKPKLWGSKDYSSSTLWVLSSGNIWVTTNAVTTYTDVANLIFNNESSCGIKRTTLAACTAQGNWYINPTDKKVYLYSTSNPGTYYTHIEVGGAYIGDNIEEVVKVSDADYVTIRNLDVRYSPNNGIIFMYGCTYGIAEYCDVSWVGGMWVSGTPPYRMGNGIGVWVDANNLTIRYNYVHDCYDAGISPQGGTTFNQTNIQIYYNKVVNCYYSYEIWADGAGVTMNNVNFYNNTCVNATSWSVNQRPDAANARHIMIWTLTGNVINCNIKNNIFVTCANPAIRIDNNWAKMSLNNNLYNVTSIGLTNNGTYTTLAQWQSGTSQDANSVSGNPLFVSSTDYHLSTGSPAINKGVNIPGLTQDFEGTSIVGLPDIGAYEFNGTIPPYTGPIWYVSTTGSNTTGDGSPTKPWATLNYACTRVTTAGDTIHVNAGDYIVTTQMSLSPNVYIVGDGDASHIISRHQNAGYFEAVILLSGGSNTKQSISNIRIDGDNLTGYQAIAVYGRSNVEIHHCTIQNFRFKGVLFGGNGSNNSIHHSTIDNCAGGLAYGFGDEGMNIHLTQQTNFRCYNNIIKQADRGNNYNGVGIGGYEVTYGTKIYDNQIFWTSRKWQYWNFAIELWHPNGMEIYNNYIEGEVDLCKQYTPAAGYAYTVYFHDNTVGWTTIQSEITLGLQFEAMNTQIVVARNKFRNVCYGVYFCNYHDFDGTGEYMKDVWVFDNEIYNIGVSVDYPWGAGIFFEAGSNDDGDPPLYYNNVNIWSNTIVSHPTYPARYGIDLPCHARNTSTMYIDVKNNIVVGFSNYGIGAKQQDNDFPMAIDRLNIQDNVLYRNGNSNNAYFVGVTLTNYTNDGGIKSDPLFISSTDFHLNTGSPAIAQGTAVTLPYGINSSTDLDNKPWRTPRSIGAYESTDTPPIPTIIYVSSTGNDVTGDGSITSPWFTLNKAWTIVQPGTIIYMRGGAYQYSNEQTLTNKNGTLLEPIKILAYQNEKPIISPSSAFYTNGYNDGIIIRDCEYIHVKGLEITGYVQPKPDDWGNGMTTSDIRHCVFENLNIHHGCFGMTMGNDDGITDDNLIYNCDFHHNSDPITSFPPPYSDLFAYGNADGLTIRIDGTLGLGTTNYVIGCRMYYNSDDGIDLWSNEGMIIIKDSWSFLNGYYNDTTNPNPGDGNGFKLGLTNIDNHGTVLRKVYNCIGYMNKSWGFVRNGAACNIEVYNNTAYSNGSSGNGGGFFFGNDGGPVGDIPFYIKNNIAYSNVNNYSFWSNELLQNVSNNTWNLPVTVTNADFVSLTSSELTNPRQSDGSLPNINFLHLATGSDLIGKGVDVGIPHQGTNPDLGAFDYIEQLSPYHQIIVSGGYHIKTGTSKVTTDIR